MYNFKLVNADTDSIMVCKENGELFSVEEQQALIGELNNMFPEHINWDEDGYFSSVVVIKAKNYVLKEHETNKIKIKGSGLKDSKKEFAMREMMSKIVEALLNHEIDKIQEIYESYIKEAILVKDIMRWSQKKTVTESVLNCANGEGRKNEMDVYKAIENETVQAGDKIYLYPVIFGTEVIPGGISEKTGKPLKDKTVEITGLKLAQNWSNDHDVDKLLDRVYATIKIFKSVIDINQFVDYTKKSNHELLKQLKRNIL